MSLSGYYIYPPIIVLIVLFTTNPQTKYAALKMDIFNDISIAIYVLLWNFCVIHLPHKPRRRVGLGLDQAKILQRSQTWNTPTGNDVSKCFRKLWKAAKGFA